MNILLGAGALILCGALAANTLFPRAQPPQIIYVRADPPELKRDEGAGGCLPLVVLALVVIIAVGLL